jgi:hypothetical protein
MAQQCEAITIEITIYPRRQIAVVLQLRSLALSTCAAWLLGCLPHAPAPGTPVTQHQRYRNTHHLHHTTNELTVCFLQRRRMQHMVDLVVVMQIESALTVPTGKQGHVVEVCD